MFRQIDDFLKSWDYETQATLRVFGMLDESSLDRDTPQSHRNLLRLSWHLVETLSEMPARFGVNTGHFDPSDPPATLKEICVVYQNLSSNLADAVSIWSESDLEQQDDMYGEQWTRGFSLMCLILHQAHHRGQMTVLLRQLDRKVPEIYGPVRESWATYGAPVPVI